MEQAGVEPIREPHEPFRLCSRQGLRARPSVGANPEKSANGNEDVYLKK